MKLPILMTTSQADDGGKPTIFSPLHERLTQQWRQFPAAARDVMHRTLGGLSLAPLPANPQSQFSRHQPDRAVVRIKSIPANQPLQSSGATEPLQTVSHYPTPLGFVALLSAYRPTGGAVRGDDLSRYLRSEEPGHLTNLARRLVSGAILRFSWRQTLWVPLFQFKESGSTVRPEVARVMDELEGAFDSWEMAVWFIQPNSSLNELRPLELLGKQDADVLEAARVDRFVAMG